MVALDRCMATGRYCRSVWWSTHADSYTGTVTDANTDSWLGVTE